MSKIIWQRTWLGFVGMALLLAGPAVAPADAAPPAITFVSPTPPSGSTVTTNAVSIAFRYNRTPARTRSVTCTLSGPTASTKPCSAPAAAAGGARSGVSYTGLADGAYTFRVTVRLNNGNTFRATRSFTVDTPQTLYAMRADYWTNTSGRYLAVQAFTANGGTTAGSYVGPTLAANWRNANGAVLGSGTMTPFVDASTYVRHRTRFRLGSLGTGGMPASVRVVSSDGQTDTVPVRLWIDVPTSSAPGFQRGFNTHYADPYEVRAHLNDLALEFPDLIEAVNLPLQTSGYQRQAQAIIGVTSGPGALPAAAERPGAVVLTSRAQGHAGGNEITAQLAEQGLPNAPLSTSVTGSDITVNLATDAAGDTSSTAKQVVDALNATPGIADMVVASTFRGDTGAGTPKPTAGPVQLSDFLSAPAAVPRGPFQQQVYRIGADRSGARLGVFLYCQESGREWVTPLVCSETAERLARNYATDPETRTLLDNLEIFIVPSVNPDGALYSMYDFSGQSKTMTSTCPDVSDPAARNTWGVAIARNFGVGSLFDGYAGASTSCDAEAYAGFSELSELETQNLEWVVSTFPNIRFAANVSTGGTVTWSPGAYRQAGRATLPAPSPGMQGYFRNTARSVVGAVNDYRGTTIGTERVDAGVDVQGSEAGNSTDDLWYNRGIFALDIGTGVPRPTSTTSAASIATGFQPCFAGVGSGGGQGSCPANGALVNEGFNESMEFADGAYALFRTALDYANDTTAPTVATTVQRPPGTATAVVNFTAADDADVYYTTDGSTPTFASTLWKSPVGGAPRPPLTLTQTTTVSWIAVDVKGNTSAAQSRLVTVP